MTTRTHRPSLARSSAVMASGSAVSRVLGVVRASMIFAIFSNSTAGDTWQVANTLPNTINLLLVGGVLNAVLVPQITKAERRGRAGAASVDTLLTVAILAMALITVIALPLTPWLVRIFASGQTWTADAFSLSTRFAVLCMPAVFFYGLYAVLGQVLNARQRFGAYMWAPVLCNVVWIAGLLVFHLRYRDLGRAVSDWSPEMVTLIAGTMTLGVALQALVLIWPLWRDGFRYRPRLSLRGSGLRSAGTVASWTFLALCVSQLGFIVSSQVLTGVRLGDAGLMGYQNAFLLFMTPHGLITVSLVTALFTSMSQAVHSDSPALVGRDVRRGMRLIGITMIPVSVLAIVLGTAGTRVLFPGNTVQATDAVAYIMWAMMLGLPSYGVYYLIQRAFYAFEDARTPFWLQLINTGLASVVALGCLMLPSAYRAIGIGVGQALANTVTALVAIGWLRTRLGGLMTFDVVQVWVRTLVACVPAGIAAYLVFLASEHLGVLRIGALLALIIGVPLFAVLFLRAAARLRITEVADLVRPVTARVRGLRGRA